MSFLRGTRHGVCCLASAAACRPLGDRPPSADRSIEIGSMLLTRLDSLALVAHATRRGRLSARHHWWGPPSRQQPRGGRWRPVTEDGPETADLSAHGQGGALSPQRCLYITGFILSLA